MKKLFLFLVLCTLLISCSKEDKTVVPSTPASDFPAWGQMKLIGNNASEVVYPGTFGKFKYLNKQYDFSVDSSKVQTESYWAYKITISYGGREECKGDLGRNFQDGYYFLYLRTDPNGTFHSQRYIDSVSK